MGYNGPPKIIVLGIDGLEYNLIEEWRLKNIMQKAYCKLDLSDYNIIVTPPIWGSMLTGKIDEDVMKIWVRESEILGEDKNIKQKWWAKIGDILPYTLNRWIWDNIPERFLGGGDPFELTSNYVLDKKIPSIFQLFENPWTNGIPGYGKNVSGPLQKKITKNAISGYKLLYKKYIMKNYKKDKSELFSALEKKEFDFIFWYTTLLDNFGHIYMGNQLKLMMGHYLEINDVVGNVKERRPNSIIYIISDHGMELIAPHSCGMHSDHGFFSSNTGETIEKPFQFYDLISKHKNG